MPCQYNDTSHDYEPIDSFIITVHQQQQWQNEIHNDHSEERKLEILDTRYVIGYLFRYIGIPDKHKLREPKIGPEDTYTEHEFSCGSTLIIQSQDIMDSEIK